MARSLNPRVIERLYSICMNDAAPFRDQVSAGIALLDRGCGKPAMMLVNPHDSGALLTGDAAPDAIAADGVGVSALLLRARIERAKAADREDAKQIPPNGKGD